MSDNKFQPGEEIFDETQGHGRARIVAEDEATEGHMPRIRLPLTEDEQSDGAEGHTLKSHVVEDDETEGHVFRH